MYFYLKCPVAQGFTRFSLDCLDIGGEHVQEDKALMEGDSRGGHRPYGGDLTLIDYTYHKLKVLLLLLILLQRFQLLLL